MTMLVIRPISRRRGPIDVCLQSLHACFSRLIIETDNTMARDTLPSLLLPRARHVVTCLAENGRPFGGKTIPKRYMG